MPVESTGIGSRNTMLVIEDGAVWVKVIGGSSGGGTIPTGITPADAFANPTTALPVGGFNMVYNGATWDMQREAPSADAQARTGLAAAANMVWNGATWDRAQSDATGKAKVSLYGNNAAAGDTALKVDSTGSLKIYGGGSLTGADGASNSLTGIPATGDATGRLLAGAPYGFNGTTWDRIRNNHEVTLLASAARTASVNTSDQVNYNARSIVVTIDITAIAVATTLTVAIKYKDTLSGKYVTLLTSAALAVVGTTSLQVGAALPDTANLSANKAVPRVWRVEITNSDANSITYSASAQYIN